MPARVRSLEKAATETQFHYRFGGRTLALDDYMERQRATAVLVLKDGEIVAETNPLRISDDMPFRHYWGDLHGQSEETIGTGSARQYFAFARDLAFVDACGHQGNDFQMTSDFWKELNDLTAEFDAAARQAGSDRSAITRALWEWYVRRPGAELPARPGARFASAGLTCRTRSCIASAISRS